MRIILIVIVTLLSSCMSSHISDIVVNYPKGDIYMIDERRFIVLDKDEMKLYYVEYFKGNTFVIDAVEIK